MSLRRMSHKKRPPNPAHPLPLPRAVCGAAFGGLSLSLFLSHDSPLRAHTVRACALYNTNACSLAPQTFRACSFATRRAFPPDGSLSTQNDDGLNALPPEGPAPPAGSKSVVLGPGRKHALAGRLPRCREHARGKCWAQGRLGRCEAHRPAACHGHA